ncbi:hypothetical protein AAVH_10455 [Aphelenchoides avenae]|nr:hypothetical protein AAVH_10455 [Aphelenchus avenae]
MAENAELKRRARESHRKAVSEKAKLSLEICLLENREQANEAQHIIERERLLARAGELQEVVDGCLQDKKTKDARLKKLAQKALTSRKNHDNVTYELKNTIATLKRDHAIERRELLNELHSLRARRYQDDAQPTSKPVSVPPTKRIRPEASTSRALYFNNRHLVLSTVTGVQPRSAFDGTYYEPGSKGAREELP